MREICGRSLYERKWASAVGFSKAFFVIEKNNRFSHVLANKW